MRELYDESPVPSERRREREREGEGDRERGREGGRERKNRTLSVQLIQLSRAKIDHYIRTDNAQWIKTCAEKQEHRRKKKKKNIM